MLMGENHNTMVANSGSANAALAMANSSNSQQAAHKMQQESDATWRAATAEISARQQLRFSQSEQQPSSNRTSFSVTPSLNLALGGEWASRYPGDLMTTFGGFKSASVTPRMIQ
jgi:hypothetical protein